MTSKIIAADWAKRRKLKRHFYDKHRRRDYHGLTVLGGSLCGENAIVYAQSLKQVNCGHCRKILKRRGTHLA